MAILKFILLLTVTFFTLSCSNESEKAKKGHVAKKNNKIPYALLPDSIYRSGSITKALALATEIQKIESRKSFMSGLDLLVNKNNAAASIEFFKEAILYYPDEKSYGFLFQAYLKNNNPHLADSINVSLINRIEYSEIAFNNALISAYYQDPVASINHLEEAIQEGFVFKDRIVNEKLFDFLKDNQSFQSLIVSNFGNDAKLTALLFNAFLNSIPDLNLPYEMKQDSAKAFNVDKYINYDFALFVPGMQDSRFSRDVSNEYMYVGKFKTENGYGFVYKSFQMISDTLNPVYTEIASYDTLGNIISNATIGCFCSPLESKGFALNKDLSLEITWYETKWQFDPLEKGYAGNKMVSTNETGKYKYVITKENKLEEVKKPEEVASSGK